MNAMEQQHPSTAAQVLAWLAESWASCLVTALESMGAARPAVEWAEGAAEAPSGAALWWEQGFDILEGPACWVGLSEDAWRAIGAYALAGAGMEESSIEEARATCLEILSQSCSALAAMLGERLERVVTAAGGKVVEAAPAGVDLQTIRVALPEKVIPVQVAFAGALLQALVGAQAREEEPPPIQGAAAAVSPTLEVLRNIDLAVSVSFGQARMALQDVLKLTAGSVIELDRAIDDPVQLIVNDTVVAIGEVVVVEGNYGLRIQRIMGRDDLLQSSGVL